MDLCRKKKFGDHSHGIVQIAVKSPLDIKIPAARSRWNAQNAMPVMVRKVMGRRHDRIDIYAPKGEVNETGGSPVSDKK